MFSIKKSLDGVPPITEGPFSSIIAVEESLRRLYYEKVNDTLWIRRDAEDCVFRAEVIDLSCPISQAEKETVQGN